MKDGCFLVEFLPELKKSNAKYIFDIILMAENAGLELYTKVSWFKAEIRNGKLVNSRANAIEMNEFFCEKAII